MSDILIEQKSGEKVRELIDGQLINGSISRRAVISVTDSADLDMHDENSLKYISNPNRLNDFEDINGFFSKTNSRLLHGGFFIGYAETKDIRKKRILNSLPLPVNYIYYSFDYLIKRVAPKIVLAKKIYNFFTRGRGKVLSRAEILGRLCVCGFEIVNEGYTKKVFYFVARKNSQPLPEAGSACAPLITLDRVGKGGKIIKVYKMRTMHPYSEYLQDYVYKMNNLQKNGKMREDFRITTIGRFLRRVWIDEIPMIINWFRGELKLVGVRPLSAHYFSLYNKKLQEKRIRHKPGLVPPYYADLPGSLEDIMKSESKYLASYEKNPVITDFRYFFRAWFNIIFRRARSN